MSTKGHRSIKQSNGVIVALGRSGIDNVLTSPAFQITKAADLRGAANFRDTGRGLGIAANDLVVATTDSEGRRNPFAKLSSIFWKKIKRFGKRIGIINCAPS